jgi:hypothetical protein
MKNKIIRRHCWPPFLKSKKKKGGKKKEMIGVPKASVGYIRWLETSFGIKTSPLYYELHFMWPGLFSFFLSFFLLLMVLRLADGREPKWGSTSNFLAPFSEFVHFRFFFLSEYFSL